ncbi:unnamed protein product [Strongylus vulgaris]|uniref:glucuronosyltransferase n=1 Tax=Strongylus vulgaris TaxID=40348 RepID=A0A3P7LP80_STRVU|nr:unnamed protein product [Strongylus vulgaris]
MIALALFGDQPKNSKVIEKLGISVTLKKSEINEERVTVAIWEVLENKRYSSTVKRLSEMARKQPVSPKEVLMKWTECLADFKTLDNLRQLE